MIRFGAVGCFAALPVFWTLPTAVLSGAAAASGIALINCVGNLGGYLGPYAVGKLKDWTGGYTAGLLVLAGAMLGAGLLVHLTSSLRPSMVPDSRPSTISDSRRSHS